MGKESTDVGVCVDEYVCMCLGGRGYGCKVGRIWVEDHECGGVCVCLGCRGHGSKGSRIWAQNHLCGCVCVVADAQTAIPTFSGLCPTTVMGVCVYALVDMRTHTATPPAFGP